MVYLNLAGISIISLLLVFKINYLVRYVRREEIQNPVKVFKTYIGWPIGVLLGAIALLLYCIYGVAGYYIQITDLIITLIIIATIDAKWKLIPNYLTLSVLISQIVAAFTFAETYVNILNLIISIIILLVLMLISKLSKEQIGMGDVKLITVVNLIYGLSFTVYSLIISMLIMLCVTLPMLAMKKVKLKSQIPFAPFYSIGVIVYIILNLI